MKLRPPFFALADRPADVFTTAPADSFECYAFIFVPYSHNDEHKTLTYFMGLICLLNADGEDNPHRLTSPEVRGSELECTTIDQ